MQEHAVQVKDSSCCVSGVRKMRNLLDHETSMDVMKPHEMWPMWDLSVTKSST